MVLLVTILRSKNQKKYSEFWYLTSQRYFLYKFRLKKDKPWVFLGKFRCRINLMHFLLLICGKFTRAQLAHQIFIVEFVWMVPWGCQISKFWVFFLVSRPQYSYLNWHQVCSTVKFAEQNSRFLPFLGGICMEGILRMSNFKILSIFSGFRTPL
jgi:hypothetical protein